MLVDLGLNLEVGEVVNLSDVLSGGDVLSKLHVEQTKLAVDGGAHFELALALAHEQHVLAHVVEIVLHLRHLHVAVDAILAEPLAHESVLASREVVVLLALLVGLAADELLPVEPRVLLVGALLALHVHVERGLLGAVVEAVLQHGHLRVAQQVLLLGKLSLGVENLQVEVAVAQAQYDVALVYARALLNNLLAHHSALLGRYLHHLYGHHLTVEAHVVVELAARDAAHGDVMAVYGRRADRRAEGEPHEQHRQHNATAYIPGVAAKKTLFCYLSVHSSSILVVKKLKKLSLLSVA